MHSIFSSWLRRTFTASDDSNCHASSEGGGTRVAIASFNSCSHLASMLSSRFSLSVLSARSALYTCIWNWSYNITYLLTAMPCLKRDETWFVYNFLGFHFRTLDFVRSAKFWGEFDHVRLPNLIKVKSSIGLGCRTFDWLRRGFIHAYLIIVEYNIKGKYPEEYWTVDNVGSENLLTRISCFV